VNCDEIQLLLPEYLVSEIRDPAVDWNGVAAHLQRCPACAEKCEETRWIIGLIRSNADLFTRYNECAPSSMPETVAGSSHMTIEAGWEDLKRRVPDLARLEKRQKRLTVFRRLGSAAAIAASIAVAVTLGMDGDKQFSGTSACGGIKHHPIKGICGTGHILWSAVPALGPAGNDE